ncbi:hypothetical protein DFH27DRAFT_618585 [Peziza echinospora]|nr:hypothetical protein DFH27DRAFT_618585 [Peziza echinospora]
MTYNDTIRMLTHLLRTPVQAFQVGILQSTTSETHAHPSTFWGLQSIGTHPDADSHEVTTAFLQAPNGLLGVCDCSMLLASILDDWTQCGNRSTSIQRRASGGEIRSTTRCFQRFREGMSMVADCIPYIRHVLRPEKQEARMELEEAIEQTESRHLSVVEEAVAIQCCIMMTIPLHPNFLVLGCTSLPTESNPTDDPLIRANEILPPQETTFGTKQCDLGGRDMVLTHLHLEPAATFGTANQKPVAHMRNKMQCTMVFQLPIDMYYCNNRETCNLVLILEQTPNPGPISHSGCMPATKSSVDLGEYKADDNGRLGRRVNPQDCLSDNDESNKVAEEGGIWRRVAPHDLQNDDEAGNLTHQLILMVMPRPSPT